MNICIVDYDLNPPWVEAVRILAYELSRQLVKKGHSIHVVTSAGPTLPLEEEIGGIFFHRVSKKPFLSYFLARKVKKLHQTFGFDVIHVQNAIMKKSFIVTLLLLRKWVKVPIVAYICLQPTTSPRDFIQFLRLRKQGESFSRLAGWLVGTLTPKFFVRKEFSMAEKIIASSNYLKTAITRLGIERGKIDTIYPFINIHEFVSNFDDTNFRKSLGIESNTPLILYIGSTEAIRLGNLLKALPIVLKEVPDSKVVLVSPYSEQFSKLAEKLGLEHAFIPLSQYEKINMANLMATSNVYVYSGLSAIASVDPPVSIIEAMAIGIPIVATETGGIPEIIQDGTDCALVKPFDFKKMASALINHLENVNLISYPERRKTNLLNAHFDSNSAAKRFVSIYESLI